MVTLVTYEEKIGKRLYLTISKTYGSNRRQQINKRVENKITRESKREIRYEQA